MKIGDKVRIRQWDDMFKEFGVNEEGDIQCPQSMFIAEMKEFCGKEVTVSKVYKDGIFFILEDAEDFEWCEGMIDKNYKPKKEYQQKHMKESVDHPSHYNQGIEEIDYIESHNMGFNLGNVIKYVTRAKHKGSELEDLKKAKWYLDREIKKLEK